MYKKYFKRLIDFLLSLLASPFVCIIVVIMAPIIYLNDRGPVFYNASRRGKDGKTFKMYKFRSMMVNAPALRNEDGSTYSGDNDPRVTKVGKIMRKLSIDELPQVFNILKGDMSIIGPRPTLPTRSFSEIEPQNLPRYEVRPGLTGYSQAYFRNSITQEEKFKHDVYYVENLTFMMDLKIFFHSIKSVLMRENINSDQTYKKTTSV